MSEWVKVIIQGVVQGFTEFLPVSSTGHLLVFSALLNFQESMGGTFEIFIQIGTLVAVLAFYRADLWAQVKRVPNDRQVQRLWFHIVVASVPIAVIGLLLVDFITEELFPPDTAPYIIAVTLIIGGVVFLWVENQPALIERMQTGSIYDITLRQAVLIGLAQALALIPGTSRSGASIMGALLVGVDRPTATTFSFYLSIPALGGATIIQFLSDVEVINTQDAINLFLGAFVAGVVAWFTIEWLLRYVAHRSFALFGYYRIIVGILLFILLAIGIL